MTHSSSFTGLPGIKCVQNPGYRNWAQTVEAHPSCLHYPSTVKQVQQIVKYCADHGLPCKPVGSRHSPSDIGATTGHLVSIERLSAVLDFDERRCRVRFEAGISLEQLISECEKHGMALRNLGSIMEQSLAGAIATGTHGTGLNAGIIATNVISFKIVDGTGQLLECSEELNSNIYWAGLCSLGALGIIVEATLQCEPFYRIKAQIEPAEFDDAVGQVLTLARRSEHFKLLYYPHTSGVRLCALDRTTEPEMPNRASSWFRDSVVGYYLLELLYFFSTFFPTLLVPWINRLYMWFLFSVRETFVAKYYQAFTIECLFKQYVNEWAFPVEHTEECLRGLRKITEKIGAAHFPIEVRFVRQDKIWLSPCYARDSCFIGIIMYRPYAKSVPYELYWKQYEKLMLSFGGRPHWAKAHGLTHRELAKLYPNFKAFNDIRKKLDPHGIFLNDYLREKLGCT